MTREEAQEKWQIPEEVELARLREKYERDQASSAIYLREKGIEKGFEIGAKIASERIALSLKKQGLLIEFIAKNTGLSIEEIEKL